MESSPISVPISTRAPELRDPDAARLFLEAGLALARTTPTRDPITASSWLFAALTEAGFLPPAGFVIDLGTLLLGGTIDARAPTAADPQLARLVSAYEHQVLARIAGDPFLLTAGDAIARLPRALVASAIGLTTATLLSRIGFVGLALPAGAIRALTRGRDRDPFAALRDDAPSLERLTAGYERLVHCARGARSLLAEQDVFVLEHLDVLESLAQRVAMAQVLEAEEALTEGLPKRLPRRRAGGPVATALEDEDTYPVGGFSSITTSGSLENVVTSELVYMDDDASLDLFDLRYAEGELLYYTRDEATLIRRRRAIDFVLDPSLESARSRDADLPWQRSIAALAIVHAAILRVAAWLGDEELRMRVIVPPALEEERALMTLLLREQHERGIAEVIQGDAATSRAALEQAAARGLGQQVLMGGSGAPSRKIEVIDVDIGTGDVASFRARLAELLRKLP
ncbi:MAG: hypothetical protein ACXVEF_02640 [Polyangiales bacterium]